MSTDRGSADDPARPESIGAAVESSPLHIRRAPEGDGLDAHKWSLLAEEVAGVGYWHIDVTTGIITWSEGLFRLYGLTPGSFPDFGALMGIVHPDDTLKTN